ncbi:uncharacterized protein LOC125055971 [Pieris napi]|uniref:uncharacterized protein LOC125055971 n=1 Tax=Pieris napi TaxID=78633 RepID=UPI001FBB4AA0|nr:uncharacterized protein LOC125055971 [Pieris napi]
MKGRVTAEQNLILLEFLREHPGLAKGINKGARRQNMDSIDLWSECSEKLNSVKNGGIKDKKGWSKYWCDLKYRTKRRYLEMKAAKENNKPLADDVSLTPIEESVLNVISDGNMDEVTIKTDPLDVYDDCYDETASDNDDEKETKFDVTQAKRPQKRSHSDENESAASSSKIHRNGFHKRDSDDSDLDDASKFLNMEEKKLECTQNINNSLQTISVQLKKLTDVISDIRDVLKKKEK